MLNIHYQGPILKYMPGQAKKTKKPTEEKIEQSKASEVIQPYLSNIYVEESFDFMQSLPEESIDLIVADGPYAVTNHKWDKVDSIQEFNLRLIKRCSRILKPGGALYLFGKSSCLDFIDYRKFLQLNSRIIWYQPSRLAQGRISYTNNYDIIAYFSKGKCKSFNLDDIRVPQLVELEHRKRVENVPSVKKGRFGKTKFNSRGKNPGDVWGDIKQLTYKSKELLSREMLNTIQKPEKLLQRLVLASSNRGDVIYDPFAGTGTTAVVASRLGRQWLGSEINARYAEIAVDRIRIAGFSANLVGAKSESSGDASKFQYSQAANS